MLASSSLSANTRELNEGQWCSIVFIMLVIRLFLLQSLSIVKPEIYHDVSVSLSILGTCLIECYDKRRYCERCEAPIPIFPKLKVRFLKPASKVRGENVTLTAFRRRLSNMAHFAGLTLCPGGFPRRSPSLPTVSGRPFSAQTPQSSFTRCLVSTRLPKQGRGYARVAKGTSNSRRGLKQVC